MSKHNQNTTPDEATPDETTPDPEALTPVGSVYSNETRGYGFRVGTTTWEGEPTVVLSGMRPDSQGRRCTTFYLCTPDEAADLASVLIKAAKACQKGQK